MNKEIVFMFSGQGSQYYQMGKELYEHNERFRYWMDHCDGIVSPLIETSLIDVLYREKGRGDTFDNILYTNPALLSIEYSMFKILEELNIRPDFIMGYSLGEFTTSIISGAVSLTDGLRLVIDMARLLEEKTVQTRMLAIMGSQELMTDAPELFNKCSLTGTNFSENFVVCGPSDKVQHLQSALHKKDIISQMLPVKYGFHTAYVDPIERSYKQLVRNIEILPVNIPVLSTLKKGIIQQLDQDHLWEVIRYPVNFRQTVDKMLEQDDYIFIDLGPAGSLATFIKYILPPYSNSITLQTINPFGRDLNAIEKLKKNLQ